MAKKSVKKVKKQKQLYGIYLEGEGTFSIYTTKPSVVRTRTQVQTDDGEWKTDEDAENYCDVIKGTYLTELCEDVTKYIKGIKPNVVYKLNVTPEEA